MAEPLLAGSPDHVEQLTALGLRLEYFFDALRAGEQARRLVTENDPKSAAGTDDYFRRVRVLREVLIEKEKWLRADLEGLPLVVNPKRTMAIGVLLGDNKTGWVGSYHPRSRRPVGDKKIKLVAHNSDPELDLGLPPRRVPQGEIDLRSEDLANVRTWFLVTRRRRKGSGVRVSSELSEPSETGLSAYVERWNHRIPFPDLVFEDVVPYLEDQNQNLGGYEVAVDEK